jgi:hypothetical protein
MTATIKKRAAKSGGKVTGRLSGKAIELPEGTWERIRQKAYELWVARGGGEGGSVARLAGGGRNSHGRNP